MAVSKDPQSNPEEGVIRISNGDWQALSRIVAAYGLNDESDAIAFALGILEPSKGGGVVVETAEGRKKYMPADKLKRHV